MCIERDERSDSMEDTQTSEFGGKSEWRWRLPQPLKASLVPQFLFFLIPSLSGVTRYQKLPHI